MNYRIRLRLALAELRRNSKGTLAHLEAEWLSRQARNTRVISLETHREAVGAHPK